MVIRLTGTPENRSEVRWMWKRGKVWVDCGSNLQSAHQWCTCQKGMAPSKVKLCPCSQRELKGSLPKLYHTAVCKMQTRISGDDLTTGRCVHLLISIGKRREKNSAVKTNWKSWLKLGHWEGCRGTQGEMCVFTALRNITSAISKSY